MTRRSLAVTGVLCGWDAALTKGFTEAERAMALRSLPRMATDAEQCVGKS
ncbi:MAG: hypothetical protein KAW89_09370 [Armatimonadetes bacterium]|nr:hypothetical protein [Armatimonadota bacterium]